MLLLLFLIGQIDILWNLIDPLSQLTSLSHSTLLFPVLRFIGTLLLPCSQLLWAKVWVDRIVELPVYWWVFHGLLCFEVGILEHVFTLHQSRYWLILLMRYQMGVLTHHSAFLWGFMISEYRLAWCQTLRRDMMLHASANGGGFWFCISYTMHGSHMILAKLRFHVKAILQVIKVLSMSLCLVVQLTALSIFVLVGHKPRLCSMLPLVAIDALIFYSYAGSSSQCLLGQCLITGILMLKVWNILEILTLGIVTCQTLLRILLACGSCELLWLLWLDSSDQFAQELLLVINFGVIYDFIHQVFLIFGAA